MDVRAKRRSLYRREDIEPSLDGSGGKRIARSVDVAFEKLKKQRRGGGNNDDDGTAVAASVENDFVSLSKYKFMWFFPIMLIQYATIIAMYGLYVLVFGGQIGPIVAIGTAGSIVSIVAYSVILPDRLYLRHNH